MKKKVALTAAAVALVGTLAVGGTLAWFTDTETATNVVTMGEVDVTLDETGDKNVTSSTGLTYTEVMPGDTHTKKVSVHNIDNAAYVRAKIEITANELVQGTLSNQNSNDDIKFVKSIDSEGNKTYHTLNNWKKANDGSYYTYIYYDQNNGVMNADDASGEWTVFEAIEIPEDWGNEFTNATFNIKVTVEAIQAANMASVGEAFIEFEEVPEISRNLGELSANKGTVDKESNNN